MMPRSHDSIGGNNGPLNSLNSFSTGKRRSLFREVCSVHKIIQLHGAPPMSATITPSKDLTFGAKF